jgi:putative ABC transport system ATP-binding protein
LADEPTGNLDTKTSQEIMKILKELNEDGNTIILITHEPDIAKYAQKIVHLKDGKVSI